MPYIYFLQVKTIEIYKEIFTLAPYLLSIIEMKASVQNGMSRYDYDPSLFTLSI